MSNFRDLIARMAIDAEFARHTRANPDAVARQYHLSHGESEQLRGLADAATSAGPTALGARLSKMGGITTAALSGPFFTGPDTDHDGIVDLLDTDDDNDGIPDASDSKPLVPNLLVTQPHLPPTGPVVTLDPDVTNPTGDADGDKIPNFLDKNDSSTDTTHERWGDNDHDKIPNIDDPDTAGEYILDKIFLDLAGDNDGDGLVNPLDSNDSNPDTTNEALGDKDHDGIYNYLDKFNIKFPVGDIVIHPEVLDPSAGGGTPPPPPPAGDPAPPPAADPAPPAPTGGDSPSTPDIIVNVDVPPAEQVVAAPQQPILLNNDAVGKPVAVPTSDEEGGLGTPILVVGGVALAAGAVAGGIAGKVLSDKGKDEE
ncbi:hypothetical protein [Rhizocola hellebori]|nr:hypothetical protein [Rhizocola hellebori]